MIWKPGAIVVDLMADYCDWPLWGPNGLLGEDDLPLSDDLKHRIKAWFNAFDDHSRQDWPLWAPPPEARGTEESEERAWVQEGEVLRELIERELGDPYVVLFRS